MAYLDYNIHFVFRTKNSEPTITPKYATSLYKFILSEVREKGCVLLRINSMPDHVHMAVQMSPDVPPAPFMRDIKSHSSSWMRHHPEWFPTFRGWAASYYGGVFNQAARPHVVSYIARQQEHHMSEGLQQEMAKLFANMGMSDRLGHFMHDTP